MNRKQAKNKTIDLLLGDNNPNADFYVELFENYNYGDPEKHINFACQNGTCKC